MSAREAARAIREDHRRGFKFRADEFDDYLTRLEAYGSACVTSTEEISEALCSKDLTQMQRVLVESRVERLCGDDPRYKRNRGNLLALAFFLESVRLGGKAGALATYNKLAAVVGHSTKTFARTARLAGVLGITEHLWMKEPPTEAVRRKIEEKRGRCGRLLRGRCFIVLSPAMIQHRPGERYTVEEERAKEGVRRREADRYAGSHGLDRTENRQRMGFDPAGGPALRSSLDVLLDDDRRRVQARGLIGLGSEPLRCEHFEEWWRAKPEEDGEMEFGDSDLNLNGYPEGTSCPHIGNPTSFVGICTSLPAHNSRKAAQSRSHRPPVLTTIFEPGS